MIGMSALCQKQTHALQQITSDLHKSEDPWALGRMLYNRDVLGGPTELVANA